MYGLMDTLEVMALTFKDIIDLHQTDSSVSNNWSYSGNTNPYTGEIGSNSYNNGSTTFGTSNSLGGSCPALSLSC